MKTRQAAADELAARLQDFADTLASRGLRPRRVSYGPTRAAGLLKHRSPKGFSLSSVGPRLLILLPDGRLWQYHERRNLEGIFFDARIDHGRAEHGSIPLDGGRFSYLGAVIGKYHFGYREDAELADSPTGFELGAIIGRDGTSPNYLKVDEAFAAIASSL